MPQKPKSKRSGSKKFGGNLITPVNLMSSLGKVAEFNMDFTGMKKVHIEINDDLGTILVSVRTPLVKDSFKIELPNNLEKINLLVFGVGMGGVVPFYFVRVPREVLNDEEELKKFLYDLIKLSLVRFAEMELAKQQEFLLAYNTVLPPVESNITFAVISKKDNSAVIEAMGNFDNHTGRFKFGFVGDIFSSEKEDIVKLGEKIREAINMFFKEMTEKMRRLQKEMEKQARQRGEAYSPEEYEIS